ncbi:Gfo/Idh/MocA family protein [Dysgonomonas macrotermitis]|uniref:Predicted dehydrogenase n=1 Tax=Dysgonomonas macrotermitis TaxID=1346286 RepID=A0A1M5IAG7_9BACT|nr:Gfo/Idh/MocA family oxidoreductase [Dysgonomonas macrotermitis]SHG25296.1 Predicted dehydrogenase [Dysgonomonas macrotermitis]
MDKINWGIIGCGDVCEKKSGPAFYKIEGSHLEAVMRRDEAKAKDFAQRHNVPKYYADADDLISDPEVQAIYVATPPSTHKEYALKALRAGKSVYVEKPMAMHYADCKEMIEVAVAENQKLFVAFYRRALPYFVKVKEVLDSGVLGDVLCVDVKHFKMAQPTDFDPSHHTWRIDKDIAGEGYFYDLAPHTLDILDFLLGEIEEARGFSANLGKLYDVKDTISAVLRFKSGVQGVAQWCFVVEESSVQDSIVITGTKGDISFSTFAFSPVKLTFGGQSQIFEIKTPEHIQQPLIQTIVDELRGIGKCPSTGESGARTSKVMDDILR